MDYLDPHRRHLDDCPHKSKGRHYTLCDCPIHVYGKLNGGIYRRSLQTTDWNRAQRLIEVLLRSPNEPDVALPAASARTVAAAVQAYLNDCEKRNLQPSTLRSYTDVFEAFAEFSGQRAVGR